jgi:hypothetical protein
MHGAQVDILVVIDGIDDLLLEARPVPLTDSVRLDDQVLRDAVGRLRSAAHEQFGRLHAETGPIGEVFSAIDELEALTSSARRIPLTSQVRVETERVYDLLDRMRVVLPEAAREARGG